MVKLKQFILSGLVFFTLNSFSQDKVNYTAVGNLEELVQKLNSNSSEITTICSDFVQEKHLEFLEETIFTKGKFWFKKDNHLRWEYTDPFNYIVIIDNGKFIIKDDEKVSEFSISSNKAFQEVNNLIISSIGGSLLEEEKFEIKAFENSSTYLVSLIPIDEMMKNVLHKIELYFNKTSLDISKVKMIEDEADYTIISFVNKKFNEDLPANIFVVN